MRKILIFLCCSLLMASSLALAAQKKKVTTGSNTPRKKPLIEEMDQNVSGQGYGMAGCGLGSLVFGEKPGMIQIVAATLNGTGVQTFAISTGTSNCKPEQGNHAQNSELFILVNREALAKDIARGNGESLASLSAIMGCQDGKLLGTKLQENYKAIFPKQDVSAEDASKNIFEIIHNDEQLSKTCANLG